ncbi:Zinc finger, C2H2 type [Popillia japonica]|uniref:Zinc finger, C2H2 type n=1 Tax=Popillia japonica TaxID=7064 RepID=A0AAW1LQT0_POPJA
MQFCRLCLVKEQVNVPIFDEQEDIRQICEKITSCLPVKVSKEDELPKKICDGCLYKLELQYQFYTSTANAEKQLLTWLELQYQFYTSTANAEKQLLTWLEQAKMDSKNSSSEITTSQTTVKQEKVEPIESTNEITEITEITTDPQSYMQQYQTDFQYKDSQVTNADIDANVSSNSDEPLAKRARRRRQASKPIPREVIESSDENDAGDSMMEMTVTKTEEESESDNEENVDDPEPAKYAAAGEDTEQPGPSGLGKGGTDAPFADVKKEEDNKHSSGPVTCDMCGKSYRLMGCLRKHMKTAHENGKNGEGTCEICNKSFKNTTYLASHKKVVHEKWSEFVCGICGKLCLTKTSLEHHEMTHTRDYKIKCDICGKGCYNQAQLEHHQKIKHQGEYLICDECDGKSETVLPKTDNLCSDLLKTKCNKEDGPSKSNVGQQMPDNVEKETSDIVENVSSDTGIIISMVPENHILVYDTNTKTLVPHLLDEFDFNEITNLELPVHHNTLILSEENDNLVTDLIQENNDNMNLEDDVDSQINDSANDFSLNDNHHGGYYRPTHHTHSVQ